MKKRKTNFLLFILMVLSGITGCDDLMVSGLVDVDDPSIRYRKEPGSEPFLKGKLWQLDGILDIETNTLTKLATVHGDSYSMLFNSDSTATGKILNTEMQVGLARPFFSLSKAKEDNAEAQLFAQIASGISGCEYFFEDSLMQFYHKDNRTCLVFKFKSVLDKTGLIGYNDTLERWLIHDATPGGAPKVILYDGGEDYFPEDIPDSLKRNGVQVQFSGNVKRVPCIETSTGCYGSTATYYVINLSSLKELP